MKRKIIKIILVSFFAALLFFGLVSYLYIYYQINIPLAKNTKEIKFVVSKGQTVKDIAAELQKEKIIRSAFWFESEVWLKKNEDKFQAGEYFLSPNLNIRKIVEKMTSKLEPHEQEITLIEGWQRNDIANYLDKEKIIEANTFLQASLNKDDWQEQFSFLADAPAGKTLEGYLFPDTYRIFQDSQSEDIIQRMLENFDNKLNQNLREEIYQQGKSIYEVITLASIVEKEVKAQKDMKTVAGIFYNRLQENMPLQSDATITFLTNKKDPRPTLEDLETDSPYNTYKNPGLPPGPISNPSLSAIEAVIYPENSDYFYFLTTADGATIFSKTLEEHNANKAKYLNGIN